MTVTLNGKGVTLETPVTLEELLRKHDIPTDQNGMAIAVNWKVVRRADWPSQKLSNGDSIEIVKAMQGG
ncbi:MAG TPA: sulfur carrier protein ThiS [Bacteroidota bacterium]|nr:sulfur carrier protein ThiS [Bacteroidota bacterium]